MIRVPYVCGTRLTPAFRSLGSLRQLGPAVVVGEWGGTCLSLGFEALIAQPLSSQLFCLPTCAYGPLLWQGRATDGIPLQKCGRELSLTMCVLPSRPGCGSGTVGNVPTWLPHPHYSYITSYVPSAMHSGLS